MKMNADTMKPSEYLAEKLREYGANSLASQYEDCERGVIQMEMHEWDEEANAAHVTCHNIHADMIEDFEAADIPGLAFKILP